MIFWFGLAQRGMSSKLVCKTTYLTINDLSLEDSVSYTFFYGEDYLNCEEL